MPNIDTSTKPVMFVYNDMRQKILDGFFKPSESLTESDLSTLYKVSRNTVKKVLLMLERENLVTIELNKGAKVRSYSLTEVLEFLEVREGLEGFIASLSVQFITDQQIARMEEILDIMRINKDNQKLVEYSKYNQEFHAVIFSACPNKTLVEMTLSLKAQMSKYNTKTILIPGRDSQSFAEHCSILEAFKARETQLAETLMRKHIHNVRTCFEENYSLLF